MGEISPQQKNTAFKLEHNLFFHRTIRELHGSKITKEVLNGLRATISEKGIVDLSPFWNHLLELKIAHPNLKLSEITAGSAPIFNFLPEPEPYCQLIAVYPETSEPDVLRSLKTIRTRFPKTTKTQLVNEKLYDIIFSMLKSEKTVGQIDRYLKSETGFQVSRNKIQEIVDTMKIGI